MTATFEQDAATSANPALATTEFEQSFPVGDSGRLVIDNPRGSIVVRGWDRPEVQVRATRRRGRSAEQFEATRIESSHKDNEVILRTVLDPASQLQERGVLSGVAAEILRAFGDMVRSTGKPAEVDYVVMVPTACEADLKGVSSSITLSDVVGTSSAYSVSGDIRVDRHQGDLRLQTVSGAIRGESVHGNTYVESVSGDVELTGHVASLAAKTVSGAIDVESSLDATSSYELRTVSGNATLRIPAESRATIAVRGVSSDVTSDLSCIVIRDSRWPGSREWQGTLNGGGATIRFQTVSGSLRLRELPATVQTEAVTPGSATSAEIPESGLSENAESPLAISDTPAAVAPLAEADPAPAPDETAAMSVLQALERGELDVDEALRRLDDLRGSSR